MTQAEHDRLEEYQRKQAQLKADRDELINAIKAEMAAQMQFHQASCPVAAVTTDLVRIKKDLYNGADKPGFIEEVRTFCVEWRTGQKIRADRMKAIIAIGGLAITLLSVFLYPSIADGWKATKSLLELADKAPTIIQLTDDWKRYYDNPPANQPPTPVPAKPKHSYFAAPGGMSMRQSENLQHATNERTNQ